LSHPSICRRSAEAKAMLHWHARHRFCSNCGAKTDLVDAGWKRACPVCKVEHFPRTDPVAIMLAVRGDRGLLGRSGRFAPPCGRASPGFVEPAKSLEDAVRRETLEEAGIKCGRVKYLYSQPWPFPMSLMNGCLAEALNDDIKMDANELVDCRWFTKDECAAMLMRQHPDGLTCPPPVAIAHHIIRTWVESDGDPSKPPSILCAGIAVQDIVFRVEQFPQPGGKVHDQRVHRVSGGCAVNAAIAVARLGGRAHYAGPARRLTATMSAISS
jgi:8-oxo-dGTP pyrophosphatase MutT (NUDIX family)